LPVFAGTTLFTVPFSVVPGSAFVGTPGALEPVSVPFSQFIVSADANCALGQGTLTAEVINDGIEVQFAGSAVGTVPDCTIRVDAQMTLEVEVPELGGALVHEYRT
jgi:hypothetical protein